MDILCNGDSDNLSFDSVDECIEKKEREASELDKITKEVERMKSSFKTHDVAFIVDGEKLFSHKTELSKKSPVFNALFTSNFEEKGKFEVNLPDKNLHHFLMFLRCTLDGYEDDLKDSNVHFIIPLAHEYQVKEMLEKADEFLADQYSSKGILKCNSGDIIQGILEAGKYGLTKTLNVLINLASKKIFDSFSSAYGYNEIQKEILHEIAMKRWKSNIDPKSGSSVPPSMCKSQFK